MKVELCESRGGRPGLPVPNSLLLSVSLVTPEEDNLCQRCLCFVALVDTFTRSVLIVFFIMVPVDVKQH